MSKNDKSNNKSHMKESFGSFIKKLRVENNLTLTQLAAKLDLDSANLSKIENGKRDFDEKRLVLLANTFNIEIDEVKKEYLGDFIAQKIYNTNYSATLSSTDATGSATTASAFLATDERRVRAAFLVVLSFIIFSL